MNIPVELAALHEKAAAVFTEVHRENEAAGQQNPDLRELVSLTSAALSALERANAITVRAPRAVP